MRVVASSLKMVSYVFRFKNLLVDILIYCILISTVFVSGKKTFIISEPYGRWGNRLMLFSYVISWAKSFNYIVINPSFKEYSKYFDFFRNNFFCIIGSGIYKFFENSFLLNIFNNSLVRISNRKFNFPLSFVIDLENIYRDTNTYPFYNILRKYRIIFFKGFIFGQRNFSIVKRNRKYLNSIFQFHKDIENRASKILKVINKEKVIGICMRQGDYKTHFNGKLFLKDSNYKKLVNNLQVKFGSSYGYFIACEEHKTDFRIPNTYISYGNPELNLCLLSMCSLLIGPPSTFMTWAAFYGNIPTCYINRDNWFHNNFKFNEISF